MIKDKKMKRLLFVGAIAMGFVSPASAVTFLGTYVPNVNTNGDIGVELSTSGVNPLDFDLSDIGDSTVIDLFNVNLEEFINTDSFTFNDLKDVAISVDFSFTAPSETGGTVNGTSTGKFTSNFLGSGLDQLSIVWDPVTLFDFGGASLELVIANLIIDESAGGSFFSGYYPNGFGTVKGAFTLLAGDGSSGLPSAVPVPAALPLFGTGLALMGFLSWRKKRDRKSV